MVPQRLLPQELHAPRKWQEPDGVSQIANKPRAMFYAVAVLLGSAVFILDLLTPRGIAISVLYGLLVLMALWSRERLDSLALAAVSTLLSLIAYLALPQDASRWALLNRGLSLALIWGIAVLVYRRKATEQMLQRSIQTLEQIVVKLLSSRGDANMNGRGSSEERRPRRWTRFWKR